MRKINGVELDDFTLGYIDCALFAETDNANDQGGEPRDRNYDRTSFAEEALLKMKEDCAHFQEENAEDLSLYYEERSYDPQEGTVEEYAGHDFWLTRNDHGAGFWDRGLGGLGERLSKAAITYGEVNIYVGDDGRLYHD